MTSQEKLGPGLQKLNVGVNVRPSSWMWQTTDGPLCLLISDRPNQCSTMCELEPVHLISVQLLPRVVIKPSRVTVEGGQSSNSASISRAELGRFFILGSVAPTTEWHVASMTRSVACFLPPFFRFSFSFSIRVRNSR